jgi:hypothetical protein
VKDRDGLGVCVPTPFATFPDPSPTCTISLRTLPPEFGEFGTCDAGGKGIIVTLPCSLGTEISAGGVGVGTGGKLVGGNDGAPPVVAAVTVESAELTTSSIAWPVFEAEADTGEKNDAKEMLVATMRHFGPRAVAADPSAVLPPTLKDMHPSCWSFLRP